MEFTEDEILKRIIRLEVGKSLKCLVEIATSVNLIADVEDVTLMKNSSKRRILKLERTTRMTNETC